MQEDFLHYVWQFKKFTFSDLKTTEGEKIVLLKTGQHNQHESGPDFFNAQLKIDGQLWAGNIEIHLKASDWYAHGHETDKAYDNVILHVVWENDMPIFRKDNTSIPTLELQKNINTNALYNYENLLKNKNLKWINCEKDFAHFSDFSLHNWLDRLYLERLEEKAAVILQLLQQSQNNWEEVLFKMLLKNFGLNINGDAFFAIGTCIPFAIIQKLSASSFQLEALLMGQADLLNEKTEDAYLHQLRDEFSFLQKKFNFAPQKTTAVKFFRLRPDNFPTIRLAQFACLYHKNKGLFAQLMEAKSLDSIHQLLETKTSAYWETHYTFGKESKKKTKALSKKFIDLLVINTIVPLQFCYAKYKGKPMDNGMLDILKSLPPETNNIVEKFNHLRHQKASDALTTQALLQLKKKYCDQNKCLQCALGVQVLQMK